MTAESLEKALLADKQPPPDYPATETQTTSPVLDDDGMDKEAPEPIRLREIWLNILNLMNEPCTALAIVVLCLQLLAGVLMAFLSTLVMSDLSTVLIVYIKVAYVVGYVVLMHRTGQYGGPFTLTDTCMAAMLLYTVFLFLFDAYGTHDAHRSMWRALETSVVAFVSVGGLLVGTSQATINVLSIVGMNGFVLLLLETSTWTPKFMSHGEGAHQSSVMLVPRIYSLNPFACLLVKLIAEDDTTIEWTSTAKSGVLRLDEAFMASAELYPCMVMLTSFTALGMAAFVKYRGRKIRPNQEVSQKRTWMTGNP